MQTPTRGQLVRLTLRAYYNRKCRRRGCPGTASTFTPEAGTCRYLSRDRGKAECGEPYAVADWKQGKPRVVTAWFRGTKQSVKDTTLWLTSETPRARVMDARPVSDVLDWQPTR